MIVMAMSCMTGTILEHLKQHGWSAANVSFGSGGALLQQVLLASVFLHSHGFSKPVIFVYFPFNNVDNWMC